MEAADWHNVEEWNKEYPEVGDLVKLEGEPWHVGIVLDILDITVPAVAEVMTSTTTGGVLICDFYVDQLEIIQQESSECQS